jgi:S-adenosylmethionine:tRNA ribosyltransferase-isomerase
VKPADARPIDLDDYAFELPPERIAQHPLPGRDEARLMRLDGTTGKRLEGERDLRVRDLPQSLRAGDLLVLNATRVLAARLRGRKQSGGVAEALLLGPVDPADEQVQRALVRSTGRLRAGLRFVFEAGDRSLGAEVEAVGTDGEAVLRFEAGASPYSIGEAPLPPYIRRPEEAVTRAQRDRDLERYQTVFARVPGAVAAPTAGLHLTPALLEELDRAGVERCEVVLHVGLGTFRPLRAQDLASGKLHAEAYELPPESAQAVARTRERGGRVIAVGTTSTRVLETCALAGGRVAPGHGHTELFLKPGDSLRVVDGLLTNFHLPRSSLLLLVAALVGREPLLRAYADAIAEGFRFYSYGDAMLIL